MGSWGALNGIVSGVLSMIYGSKAATTAEMDDCRTKATFTRKRIKRVRGDERFE